MRGSANRNGERDRPGRIGRRLVDRASRTKRLLRDAETCGRDASAPNTDSQRDSIFTKGPADVLDHATSEMAIGSKLGIDATKKLPGEGHKRGWPPLIKMDEATRRKIDSLLGNAGDKF